MEANPRLDLRQCPRLVSRPQAIGGNRLRAGLQPPACYNESASGQVASDEPAFRENAGFWAQVPTPTPIPSVASPYPHRSTSNRLLEVLR